MAIKLIKNDVVELNEGKNIVFTATTVGADGFAIDFTQADQKMVILFQNTASADGTVTIKQGNGLQGVVDLDAFTIPASGIVAFRLDSGAFKNVSGANKGNVVAIPSATTIKACAIQLP